MDQRIPSGVAVPPEPLAGAQLATAAYLLGKYLWIEAGQIVATNLWEDEALHPDKYDKYIGLAEEMLRERSRCLNGCEVNRENLVREDGYCNGCHEYGGGG